MKKLLLLVLVCACAAPQQPSNQATIGLRESHQSEQCFVAKYNIKVFCNGIAIEKKDIDRAADLFVDLCSEWLGVDKQIVKSALKDSTLEWTSSWVYTRDHKITTMAAGAVLNRDVYITWKNSISGSSLYHEWMHLLITSMTGEHDGGHQNWYWWALVPQMQEKAQDAGL